VVIDVGYITYEYGIMTWPVDDRILTQHRNLNFYIQWSVHRVICVNNYRTRCNNIQFIYICKLLYMFRVVSPLIMMGLYHWIYSIWRYWDRYCYLSWASRSRQVAVTVSIMPDTLDAVIWAPDDGWRYHPKHVEQFADINKLYIAVSCWIIIDTGILALSSMSVSISPMS